MPLRSKRVGRRRQSRHRRTRKRSQRRRSSRQQRGGAASPPLEYVAPNAQITVLITADKRKPTLNALLASLQRHAFSYKVVGMGRPWLGFETKMANLLEGINQSLSSPYIMILDAFDTVAIQDAQQVLANFQTRPRSAIPILISAEHICAENCDKGIRQWHVKYRGEAATAAEEQKFRPRSGMIESATPFFLNSGGILGTPAELQWLFGAMIASPFKDDQLAAAYVALKNLDRIDLDVEEKVFRVKNTMREKRSDEGAASGPGILHFSGMRDDGAQAKLLDYFSQYP